LGLYGPNKQFAALAEPLSRMTKKNKVLDEAPVVTGKAIKGTNITQTVWRGPVN